MAFQGVWAITGVIAGVLAIIGGFVVWKCPAWESTMKNLLWMIPVGVFTLLLFIRLTITPYTIYKNQREMITKLQTTQAQKERDAKQDIRTLMNLFSPEILQRIDAGQKKILISLSIPK